MSAAPISDSPLSPPPHQLQSETSGAEPPPSFDLSPSVCAYAASDEPTDISPRTPSDEHVILHLPLKDPAFDLAAAVCSHGLFMMAPNRWDTSTRTLRRPLRLRSSGASTSVVISHPSHPGHTLLITVLGHSSLAPEDQEGLLGQVRRMLRMSDENDKKIEEFHKLCPDAKERGFGRVFRSPNLFEDMVKCMLLCNCQWL